MKKIFNQIVLTIVFSVFLTNSFYSQVIPDGPYFGQELPGLEPAVFAPNIISLNNRFEYIISFSPDGDECCFGVTNSSWSTCDLYYLENVNGKWSSPVKAVFQGNFDAWLPFFSPDGNKIYFSSGRPDFSTVNTYKTNKVSNGWSQPQKMERPINSDYMDWRLTETNSGIMYFSSNRAGGIGDQDIYRATKTVGDLYSVKNLSREVNSTYLDASPFISPDGKYLLMESWRPGGYGLGDLYICFLKDDGKWTTPLNLGSDINTDQIDDGGFVSYEGRCFFFNRRKAWYTNVATDIYWVDSKILFKPYINIPISDTSFLQNDKFAYKIPSDTFRDYNDSIINYSATLSNGNNLPGWINFYPDNKTFSGLSNKITTLSIKVTATDNSGYKISDNFSLFILTDKTKTHYYR